jgi:hypothetical protein
MDYQGRLLQDRHFWHSGEVHEVEEGLGAALIAEGRAESMEPEAPDSEAVSEAEFGVLTQPKPAKKSAGKSAKE